MKRIMLLSVIFSLLFAFPVMGGAMTQEDIDRINLERVALAEAEIARVQAAAKEKAQNEIDAANATAEAFAEDVERRRDAYEDWVDEQRVLAGLEEIYDDEEEDVMVADEAIVLEDNAVVDESTLPVNETADSENVIITVDTLEDTATGLEIAPKGLDIEVIDNDSIEQTQDFINLCKIVEAEAPRGGIDGKIMVANVIINRVNSPDFSNTITGVIMERGQFAPVRNGLFNRSLPSQETKEAVSRALAGENKVGKALYFRSAKRGNTFMGKTCIASAGGNNFYN